MKALRRYLVPILAIAFFATCDEFPADPMGTDTSGPIQLNINAGDWPESMGLGGSLELEVQVTDAQGHTIMDPPVDWTLETPTLGNIQGTGTSSAVTVWGTDLGWLRITVSLNDESGRFTGGSLTDSIQVMLAGIRVIAPSADTTLLSLEDTVVVEAVGVEDGGGDVGYDGFEWQHSGGSLEALEQGSATLRLRSVQPGEDTVFVRAPGACPGGMCEARVVIRVEQEPSYVQVNPSAVTIERDSSAQLTATAYDARGHDIRGTSFDWFSGNTGVAEVNFNGLVTGVSEGETTVTARIQDTFMGTDATITVIRGRGTVEGHVYRDDDASGSYGAGFDTPMIGAPVDLVIGTSAGGTVLSSTNTDDAGYYQFGGVPAGDYVVVVTAPPATTIDVPTKQIAVIEYQTTTTDFTFTGAVLGPISDARAAVLDELVAFDGVVTSATTGEGMLADSIFYVQDGSAAIAVYTSSVNFPGGFPTLSIGDSVRVLGTRQVAVNQLEWVEAQSVTGLGIGRADTLDVGANDINNLVWPSRLVRIWDVVIDSVTGAAAQNVWARGNMELGGITFRMYLNAGTGLNGDSVFHLHRAYTVTGILTRHNTTYELKPRRATDVQPGLLPLTSIGIARDLTPDSMWVSVAGVVSAGTDVFGPQQFYMQDATAGIRVYLPVDTFPDGLPTVSEGDSVRIQGARITYNDEAEIMASYVSVEGYSGPVVPYGISAGEINAGASQGELHSVFEVVVDSITGAYSQNVWVRDVAAGEVLMVYMDGDIGIAGPDAFTVGQYYDITGVVARYLSTFQILPRGPDDITEIIMPMPVADARAAAIGTELAVTGVLSAGVAEFDADVMHVQDGTGGIALYFPPANYPTVPSLGVGDSVRITGFRSELNGEARIDVYQYSSYGGGFPVDTLDVAAADIDGGMYAGRLVRVLNKMAVQVQGGVYFWADLPNGGYDGVWVDVGTAAMSAGVMGVGGLYDLVGIAANINGTPVLRPRFDGDVIVLDAPGALWLTFLNIPTDIIDSVQYNITAGGVTQPEVKLGADYWRRYASMKLSQGTSSAWAWAGVIGFDSLAHRSLDKGEFLDTDANADVVACLVASCATSSGGGQDQFNRNEVQAPMEMYGLYPTREDASDNESFATAHFLNWTFKDAVAGHIYYAHAGMVDETTDVSDIYTFYAAQGDLVTIEILARRVNAEGNLDSFLKLYDPAGSPLATDDDGTGTLDSMIQFTASESGNYFIEVTEYGGAGVYNLRIQKDF